MGIEENGNRKNEEMSWFRKIFKSQIANSDENTESKVEKRTVNASDIMDSDTFMTVALSKNVNVNIDSEELRRARWVNVNEELPEREGIYFILTDEHWCQGVAFYTKNEETGNMEFDVWWATSGKDPKVEFWLKDSHWGMVYQLKKERKEI